MRTFVTDRQTDGRSWLHRTRGAGPKNEPNQVSNFELNRKNFNFRYKIA